MAFGGLGGGFGGVGGWARRIKRSADRIGPVRKKRRWYRGSGRPVGPKLVAGLGLKRRRADTAAPYRWVLYLTLAVGFVYALYAWLERNALTGIFSEIMQ